MARDITGATSAESQKSSGAKPIVFAKLEFDSGDVRVWSGVGDIPFEGEIYSGLGDLGKISPIEEGIEQRAFGISLTLSGIPPSAISLALDEDVQGRDAQVWLGFLDDDYALIADPVLMFRGRMDTMGIKLGDQGLVTVTAESRLVDWDRPQIRRYTDASQRERFPGDRGFEFVNQAVEREINWGGVVAGGQGGGVIATGQGGGDGGGGGRGASVPFVEGGP